MSKHHNGGWHWLWRLVGFLHRFKNCPDAGFSTRARRHPFGVLRYNSAPMEVSGSSEVSANPALSLTGIHLSSAIDAGRSVFCPWAPIETVARTATANTNQSDLRVFMIILPTV